MSKYIIEDCQGQINVFDAENIKELIVSYMKYIDDWTPLYQKAFNACESMKEMIDMTNHFCYALKQIEKIYRVEEIF